MLLDSRNKAVAGFEFEMTDDDVFAFCDARHVAELAREHGISGIRPKSTDTVQAAAWQIIDSLKAERSS